MNVYDTANKLALEIRQSEEYMNYKKVREMLLANPDLKKKMGEFEMARYEAQIKQMQTGKEDVEKTNKTFKKEINENGCIGSISEMYDSVKPQLPKGAIAQAWSVAEVFRIIMSKRD